MTTTTLTVVNEALGQIAAEIAVTGSLPTFDGSAAGIAAGLYYTPVVNIVLREQDYEFSRFRASLSTATSVTPPTPWTNAYLYPADCIRIRQILPATWTQNDPQPVRWSEGFVTSPSNERVIFASFASAVIVYTSGTAGVGQEGVWDSLFQEAVVRLLASVLALDLSGRPDLAEKKLLESGQLVQISGGLDS